jgi:hypothetical protein
MLGSLHLFDRKYARRTIMAPLEENSEKPRLSIELLEQEGIFFFPEVHESKNLPKLIKPIQEHLLHFRGRLPGEWREGFAKEREIFRTAWESTDLKIGKNWDLLPPELETGTICIDTSYYGATQIPKRMKVELRTRDKTSRQSIALRKKRVLEDKWVSVLQRNIFKTFEEVHDKASTYE